MHHRLCRATLLRLAFFEKSELNFPFEKFLWDNAVVIKKKKLKKRTKSEWADYAVQAFIGNLIMETCSHSTH